MATRDQYLRNRFLRLPRPQQLLIIVALCGVLFVALECVSWLGLYVLWRASGRSIVPVEYIDEFQLFSQKGLFISQGEYRPYYMFGLRPNIEITSRSAYGTDRLGLMINNSAQSARDLTVDGGTYRIFVFGNSTIMGTGSERSLAAYLEAALNNGGGGPFEVITAGNDGFNSGQELARLALETIYFHPDMIVTLDGATDAFMTSFQVNTLPNAHFLSETIKRSLFEGALENKSFIEVNLPAADFFLRRFYSYHILLAALSKIGLDTANQVARADQSMFNHTLVETPVFRPEGARIYVENLDSMSAISNIRGIPTLHFLQPTLATELIERGSTSSDAEWDLVEKLDRP
jgi:hypothetical protein